MKIFSWMRSKLRGNDNTIKPEPEPTMLYDHMMHQPCKEGEFSDSPGTLLAIGTFGNNLKDSDRASIHEICNDNDDEEVDEELKRLLVLNKHISPDSSFSNDSLTTQKFLDSLQEEDEEIIIDSIPNAAENKDALIHRREKYAPSDNRRNAMYKKSLSFLLKRALLCGGGFVPSPVISPILKDPFSDHNLDNSRMEKILRAMLHKKKYPQRQRYLNMPENDNGEEQGESSNGKTDAKCNQDQMNLLEPHILKLKSSRYM